MAQAFNNLDRAMVNFLELKAEFEANHPEHAAHLEMMATGCLLTQESIKKFWAEAFGKVPEDISVWRG